MKIGCCGGFDRMEEAARAGFDYLELNATRVAGLSEADFAELSKAHADAPLPTPSFNCLFPGDIRLMDESAAETVSAYLNPALDRVALLGGKTVVFGSGAARRRPEDLPYSEAFRRLMAVTALIGDIAAQRGITVAVEPLNRRETNMVNSVAEGAALCAAVGHQAVRLLADYFHVAAENQPHEDIERVGGIAHAHIATAETRRVPVEAEPGFTVMFRAMKRTGYAGNISIEGGTDDLLRDGSIAVPLLKRLWDEA
ncbi:MAG: sugar phosphate isomerase/epimerase [Clostridia bacterium]|nr:sugar phosphate isomerase/epimerase [Clostridia bacterium]